MSNNEKKSVLIIGGGSVGAIAALNLEGGGQAEVTVVLRSNFTTVRDKGYSIESCDHGTIEGFRPSHIRNTIPNIQQEGIQPYDFIVLATKNCPDIGPPLTELIRPAIHPECEKTTTIVLLQNGLNIDQPFMKAFPESPVLSGISLIGSCEPQSGRIVQGDSDRLLIGAFPLAGDAKGNKSERDNGGADDDGSESLQSRARKQAQIFVRIYGAGGKTEVVYASNVLHDRWRKLIYNAVLNPICAILGLDTGRVRLVDQGQLVDDLVRPAMKEIVEAARACGVERIRAGWKQSVDDGGEAGGGGQESDSDGEDVVQCMIDLDPLTLYLKPSMQADVEKGNFIEFENLLGEPLREGTKRGIPMPTLKVLYSIARGLQWRTKEQRGLGTRYGYLHDLVA